MNMKEQIDSLVKLQKIETEAENLRSMLSDVSKRLETLDDRLVGFEKTVADETSALDELKKSYRSYESDVQMNLSMIKKKQEKLRSVKTNREYQILLKEIDELKAKNSQIEDEMLKSLDSIDEAENLIAMKKDEYLRLAEQVRSEKEDIRQETEQGKKKLGKLDRDWNSASGMVKPELLKKFIMVKEKVRGTAIVPVQNAVCHGCNMNIPPQMYNELQRFDSLKFCPHCQRIIYWKES